MKISWIDPVQLVQHELDQLRDEGHTMETLRMRWEEEYREGIPDSELRFRALRMLNELESLADESEKSVEEPSSLEGILGQCGEIPRQLTRPADAIITDRIAGGWLGRAAGCLLGKPVEKMTRETIHEILRSSGTWPLSDFITAKGVRPDLLERYPWNRHNGTESLRENIVCMPEDDDMNYPMLNLGVLELKGRHFSTDDISTAWLELLPVLSTFTAERVAFLNVLQGLEPPRTALYHNPYREWIGAQIRGDLFGWVSPGDIRSAITMAHTDARLSHIRNGIYGELFVAAMIAASFSVPDTRGIVEAGLTVIPQRSRLAEAIRFVLNMRADTSPWEDTVDQLYERFGRYHWVHTINNAALAAAAILHGGGDYEKSICAVVMGGWDTDSNGATVGSVVGTMLGAAKLPERWVKPLNGRIRSSMKGWDNGSFDDLARRTSRIALGVK